MEMPYELVVPGRATIGESPTWFAAEHALYWIDVKAPALFRKRMPDGAVERWGLGDADVGGFALCDDGSAIVAQRDGLHRLDLASGARTLLAPAPFDPSLFRFNEGGCDAEGRFWIGVMFDPLQASDRPVEEERLHVFTPEAGLLPLDDRSSLHNGMVWPPDGRHMFLSHSYGQRIFRYGVDARTGLLGERVLFAEVPEADGLPDGAALDEEGGYWCALHGGWALRRFHPDGTRDRDVELPVEKPTMCAFGGPDLRTLFVTSATEGLDEAALQQQPAAGGILALRPGLAGQKRHVLARSVAKHETGMRGQA